MTIGTTRVHKLTSKLFDASWVRSWTRIKADKALSISFAGRSKSSSVKGWFFQLSLLDDWLTENVICALSWRYCGPRVTWNPCHGRIETREFRITVTSFLWKNGTRVEISASLGNVIALVLTTVYEFVVWTMLESVGCLSAGLPVLFVHWLLGSHTVCMSILLLLYNWRHSFQVWI